MLTQEEQAQLALEREVLVEHHGEVAVRNHFVWLVNFHRVHALFPPLPLTDEEVLERATRPTH